ncbi:MAG: VCBS repeat-containing protein [Acidobacteria bacterium]|nr:VCBS repeat-containing protein [Acidobacteriota bacterium]
MARTAFLSFWIVVTPALAFAAATPKAPLQLDNDSWGDLILYSPSQGTFTNVYYDLGPSERFVYISGQWPAGFTVTAARLNNDNRIDAFLYNPVTGAYAFALNTGSGYTLVNGTWSPGWEVQTADFNKDGLHDLLLYNPTSGQWFQCLNDRSSGFTYTSGFWPTGRSIVPGDFNGDGRTDFFAYDAAGGHWLQALTNSSGSGFSTDRTGTWSAGWQIQAVTLNADDFTDLFLYNPTIGAWVQCVSTNDASVFRYHAETWSPGWRIAPADFDGNGINDFFLYNDQTGIWYECYTQAGGSGIVGYIRGTWSPGWRLIITDFDGDGRTDVFLYNPDNGLRFQCLNTGDGLFDYRGGVWATGLSIVGNMDRIAVPPPPPPPTPTLTVTKIMAFGDSLTFGSHSSRNFYLFERNHAAYPERLASLLQARYPKQSMTVVNAGLPGEMAFFAAPRLESAIAANTPDLVLLYEGTNDINAGFTPSQIAASLNALGRTALNKGVKVRIAKLTPIGLAYDPAGEANRLVQSVNAQITTVASTLGIGAPVDLYATISRDSSLLGADGLHPSDAGYAAIANAFFEAIVSAFQILK